MDLSLKSISSTLLVIKDQLNDIKNLKESIDSVNLSLDCFLSSLKASSESKCVSLAHVYKAPSSNLSANAENLKTIKSKQNVFLFSLKGI